MMMDTKAYRKAMQIFSAINNQITSEKKKKHTKLIYETSLNKFWTQIREEAERTNKITQMQPNIRPYLISTKSQHMNNISTKSSKNSAAQPTNASETTWVKQFIIVQDEFESLQLESQLGTYN